MNASADILALIREFEGLRLEAYLCPAGVLTIGYGHTAGVRPGQRISREEAEELLRSDVAAVERELTAALGPVPLSQGQFDALVSFTFNLGITKVKSSTLWRKLTANPADPTIPAEFRRWVYGTVDGTRQKLPGLVRRRDAEARFWLS